MTIAANPPIDLPLEKLTGAQKWELFQFLWEDLAANHSDDIEPPAWHEEVIKDRLKLAEAGQDEWVSLEDAIEMLKSRDT